MAIAPWISPGCTLNYLAQAQADDVQGFAFFLPNQGSAIPPKANDPAWNLGDGGQWKSVNEYPVYAISSSAASEILAASALYSGSLLEVPFGPNLSAAGFPKSDYVRLLMEIETGGSNNLPSLWVFLLIILAVLLAIVGVVSLTMHIVQRRRREALRQRVIAGNVNLEILGIKRMTVPQEVLDKLPTYPYVATEPAVQNGPVMEVLAEKGSLEAATTALAKASARHGHNALDQPSCAICLDDFSDGVTVRELPCRHIFHPECVDVFLRDNSSLCPLCKSSALPKGYCPAVITNAMVRRERFLERRGGRANGQDGVPTQTRSRTMFRLGRSAVTASPRSVEMTERPESSSVEAQAVNPDVATPPPASTSARQEWARRRALAMLGPRAPAEVEAPQQGRSRWRKMVGNIFPSS